MDLNLSGLNLSENHLMAFSDSAIRISNGNFTDFANNAKYYRQQNCEQALF